MNRALTKLLVSRTKLALGSLSLVEKQLSEILYSLDNQVGNVYTDTHRGEEKNPSEIQEDFFISPPLEVYDNES